MISKLKQLTNSKSFHIVMIIIIITIILCVFGIMIIKYQVEGEKNMPFDLTKIVLISSSESIDKDAGENKWAFDINQNNDIYIYIEKNKDFTEQEAIKAITIDNINVTRQKEMGTIHFYRPNQAESGAIFSNTEENLINKIEYKGAMESNFKSLEVANQGGIIAFRYANDGISEFKSNEDVINHNEILKKANINEDDLKSKISFDITIATISGKEYKANISYDLPVEGVVENGTTSKEITDLSNIIFKRTKN